MDGTRYGLPSRLPYLAYVSECPKPHIYLVLLILPLATYFITSYILSLWNSDKIPFVGFRSLWEPRWVVARRFAVDARTQINEGYEKFKNKPFKIARKDTYITVIPHHYISELQSLPESRLSAAEAHIQNFTARHASANMATDEHVNMNLVQTKLTPKLGSLMGDMASEVEYALEREFPQDTAKWTNVCIFSCAFPAILRISARFFVGSPACRDEAWLATVTSYSHNVFSTFWILKQLPTWAHPFVVHLLPCYRRVLSCLKSATNILTPIILERQAKQAKGNDSSRDQTPQDMLQWMIDLNGGSQAQGIQMTAHRQMYLALAATQSPAMTITHFLYDLCERPEYFEPLRQDILNANRKHGAWTKLALDSMRKLDSFLKESQRFNPLSLLSFSRVVMSPITLSDGTKLPKGTYISAASEAILHDEENIESASVFDGFRYSKKRDQSLQEDRLHQFGMTDTRNLHFGHGRYACPGRFFASCEIKLVLANLLLRYDFKFPEGCGRPKNVTAHDLSLPDLSGEILMRDRECEEVTGFV